MARGACRGTVDRCGDTSGYDDVPGPTPDRDRIAASPARPPRRRRRAGLVAAVAVAAVVVAGCGALGLDETGPVDATVTTSAAVAAAPARTGGAVTAPTLQTGTTASRAAPTPWQSLLTTSTPTTTSAPPQTAPSVTHTLTFATLSSVTAPTVAAPTKVAIPPPDCYRSGACPAQASATASGGKVEVLNPRGGSASIVVLTPPGKQPTALSIARLTRPTAACTGSYCLVQGTRSGLFFGRLVRIHGGELTSVPGTASSISALHLLPSSAPVVAGQYRFDSYGLGPADSPVAARTWGLAGGTLTSTGCGEPRLYATPPAATGPLRGPCSGTPRVAGYGPASGNKMVPLGGFITPSGNIHCAWLLGGNLGCTAKQNSIKVPTCTKPQKEVPTDLRGLRVLMRPSGTVTKDDCLGYTLIGSPLTKISYRRLAVGHGYVCEVQQDGVTCTVKGGRGFTLSRAALTIV